MARTDPSHPWPVGGGEAGALIRDFAWAATPLGMIAGWPQSLRTAVEMTLAAPLASVLLWGPRCTVVAYNAGYRAILNVKGDAIGRPVLEVWAEERDLLEPQLRRVLGGETLSFGEQPMRLERGLDTDECWFDYGYGPVRDETGAVAGILVTIHETTARVLAERRNAEDDERRRAGTEAALRENEERFRQFGENSADVLWIGDAQTGRIEYLSPAFDTIFGLARGMVFEDISRWLALVHPDDRADAASAFPRTLSGESVVIDYRIVRPSDGAVRWIRDSGFALRGADGRVQRVAGIARDMTEQRLAQDHQKLLLAELQHRVRNTLAVIRSIVRRTAENSDTIEELVGHLDGRLSAIARIQASVTRDPDKGVDLAGIVDDELTARVDTAKRAHVAGPRVRLTPKSAEVISLAIHELATNSVKYGVLAGDKGRIDVSWAVKDAGDRRRLAFDWIERGADARPLPGRPRGFGTELITGRIPYELQGLATLETTADGVLCHIEFPLAGAHKPADRTAA